METQALGNAIYIYKGIGLSKGFYSIWSYMLSLVFTLSESVLIHIRLLSSEFLVSETSTHGLIYYTNTQLSV